MIPIISEENISLIACLLAIMNGCFPYPPTHYTLVTNVFISLKASSIGLVPVFVFSLSLVKCGFIFI